MNQDARQPLISPQDLLRLGGDAIAYIKPVSVQDRLVYRIHAADGSVLAEVADFEVACAAVRQHGWEPLSVH